MKRSEARRVLELVRQKIESMTKEFKWSCKPIVDIVQAEEDWWGIEIRTDVDSYDDLYYYGNDSSHRLQSRIMTFVNSKMGWRKYSHYFEPSGGGILHLY